MNYRYKSEKEFIAIQRILMEMGLKWTNWGKEPELIKHNPDFMWLRIHSDSNTLSRSTRSEGRYKTTDSLSEFLAAAVKTPQKVFGGAEVEILDDGKIKIGCKTLTREQILAAITVAESGLALNIDSSGEITCEDVTGTVQELKEILSEK